MSLKNSNASKKTHKFLLNKLKDRRTLKIYKKFENELAINKNFIVAVSGGPDSLALSILTLFQKNPMASYIPVPTIQTVHSEVIVPTVLTLVQFMDIILDITRRTDCQLQVDYSNHGNGNDEKSQRNSTKLPSVSSISLEKFVKLQKS